jgi:hypothetical protein
MHLNRYICMYIYTSMNTYTYMCIHICIYVCIDSSIFMSFLYVYIHMYIFICIHIYIYIHIYNTCMVRFKKLSCVSTISLSSKLHDLRAFREEKEGGSTTNALLETSYMNKYICIWIYNYVFRYRDKYE